MAKVIDIMETQNSLEMRIMQRMDNFEARLKADTSPHTSSLESLSQEFMSFRTYTQDVLLLLRQQINEVSQQVDSIEMRHRRKYLLLGGVAEKADEDVPAVVATIIKKNLSLESVSVADISVAHRLGAVNKGRARPILFRMASLHHRAEIWKRKTSLKGSSYVLSEFLTRKRQALFMQARKHFNMKDVWTADGVIYIKLPDGGRQKLNTSDELAKLLSSLKKGSTLDKMPATVASGQSSLSQGKQEQARSKRVLKK